MIACGGTGGHVYPGIALAQGMPEAKFVFVGSKNRQDSKIIPKYGYPFFSIMASPKNVFKLAWGVCQALKIMRQTNPQIIVGTGSYHTIPVILAAKLKKLPVILLEQNVIPGRVNRLMSHIVDRVCVSFAESKPYFKKQNIVVTGNPVRLTFETDTSVPSRIWDLINGQKMVLVFGGSQGATTLNEMIASLYMSSKVTHPFLVVHITGKTWFDATYPGQSYVVIRNNESIPQAIVLPYAENMGGLYQQASLVVSRAGATTVAELLLFKKPAILIPYPFATDNHQNANAEAFCREGKGLILSESELSEKRLLADVQMGLKLSYPDTKVQNAVESVRQQLQEVLACTRKS